MGDIFKRWRNKNHIKAIKEMSCCICGHQATAHHRIGHGDGVLSDKQPDSHAIPLCYEHHTGSVGIHTIGVKTWETVFGSQWEMLARTLAYLKEKE